MQILKVIKVNKNIQISLAGLFQTARQSVGTAVRNKFNKIVKGSNVKYDGV